MNLVKTLLQEHSKAQCLKVVSYVGKDRNRFKQLVDVFLKGPYRVTQRASWPLSVCVEKHPELIDPHLKRIIRNLQVPGLHEAVKRNTVRLLQFIDIPKSLQGIVLDDCYRYLLNRKEPIAVRVFAMTVLGNLAAGQPALKSELSMVIEDQLPYASPGFLSRAKKTLKQLQ